jgi:tRNA pseudouridine38-40 synthase
VRGHGVGVKNIRLVVEYDGTGFCGWQRQPKVRTVEGEIVRELTELLELEPEVIAAARTDSGVHALGQVVNFSSISALRPQQIKNALNSRLPKDVRVVAAEEVPLAFNARYDAKCRTYRYEISMRPTSVWRQYRWYVKWNLDAEAMRQAAATVIGDHDFSAYTCKDEERSPWISMKVVSVEEIEPHGLALVFAANRFLRKMVRMLVGTLVEVGRGGMKPQSVYDIMLCRDRSRAGPCAPPHGLYLVGVDY